MLFEEENVSDNAAEGKKEVQPNGQVEQATSNITLESLPEELRGEKMFENLQGKEGVDLVTELAKQVHGLQKMSGKSVRIPQPDSGEEAMSEFVEKTF